MNRVLVAYGTKEGQTRKIAEFIVKELEQRECRVTLLDASQVPKDFKMAEYEGAIVGAPLHISNYPKAFRKFVKENSDALYAIPSAFFTVCLGVLEKAESTKKDLKKIEGEFFVNVKWYPIMHTTFAGALMYSKYNWLTRFFLKRIARKAGGSTDTTKDTEYTDWNAVRDFTNNFANHLPHLHERESKNEQPGKSEHVYKFGNS